MQKTILVLALLAVVGFASVTEFDTVSFLWDAWKIQHQKSYSAEEESTRYAIFTHAYKKIVKFNAENDTPKLALNKFADLTHNEFKSQQASCAFTETDERVIQSNLLQRTNFGALPAEVDWRNKGAVTPIKNQGQCGSCWSFSTTGVIEGFHFIQTGKLLSFSEQQIVDCDTGTNQGCEGGYPYLAVDYAAKEGLELESDYPYTAQDGKCNFDASKANTVCTGYTFVTPKSTDDLKAALVNSPVSVLIEADQDVFQYYTKGVIKSGCGDSLDHAVLAVGYTKVGVLEAFIVKNSWGTTWGEEGYVFIWDNQAADAGAGTCGILSQPLVAK